MAFALSALLVATQMAASTPEAPPKIAPMRCETGPIRRSFGGTRWVVYSCDDKASIVVLSDHGNPAFPFYFFMKPEGGAYALSGEGTGDKSASDAAKDALAKMTPAEFAALLAETRNVSR